MIEILDWTLNNWLGLLGVFLALVIFLIQVRPILSIQLRTEIKPITETEKSYNLILYADVTNEGLCPIKFKIKSQYENNYIEVAPIIEISDGCLYQDRVYSELIPKNDKKPNKEWIAAYEKCHKLKSKESTYFIEANMSIPKDLDQKEYEFILNNSGSTFIEIIPQGVWGIKGIKMFNKIKKEIYFNSLFVDAISKTRKF